MFLTNININMKKIIPLAEPPITTYPSIANVLSLLWNQKEKIIPWFSDHFIQLIVRPYHENTYGDFYDHADLDNYFSILYGAPGLGWMRTNSDCAYFDVFTDYIEYQINNGYCVEACLDRYYFKFTKFYKREHYIHSSFIFGYDREQNEIYIADFWTAGKYEKKVVSYEEINASMKNNYIINLFREYEVNYVIDKQLMKTYFLDYYHSRDSFSKYKYSNREYNKGVIYGLEYYDYLLKNLKENQIADIRMYHILYDHKILMKYRLEYLMTLDEYDTEKLQELMNKNESLISESLDLRNCIIKYCISFSDKLLNKIKVKIEHLKNLDKEFVKDILSIM